MHSSATRVHYAFDQTPSLRVRERGLARETTQEVERVQECSTVARKCNERNCASQASSPVPCASSWIPCASSPIRSLRFESDT